MIKTKVYSEIKGSPKYIGEFKGNLRHGKGSFFWPDKTNYKYEGEWKDDKRDGRGILTQYHSGLIRKIFNGEWKNNQLHGFGTYEVLSDHFQD